MKKFKITTYHQIFEDDFEHGELGYINSFDLNSEQESVDIVEAIILHFKSFGYEISKNNLELYDDILCTDVLVDADNLQASQPEIDLWKKGEIKLYNDYVHVTAFELLEVDFSKVKLS